MRHDGEALRRAAALAAATALTAAGLAACGPLGFGGGCTSADQGLLDQLAAAARTGTSGAGDLAVDRVELGKTVVVDLPDDLREYGADRLLASRASVFDAQPPSEDFPGIEMNAFVAISPEGDLVAPIGEATVIGFDVAGPDDPSWEDWANQVADSSEADEARSCVDPNA